MALRFQTRHWHGILVFEVEGEASLEGFQQLIEAVARSTAASGDKRVLANLLGVAEQLKFTDHYALGEQVVRKLGHLERLASVVRRERRTGTSERVANAHGVQLRVFVSVPEAMAWLTEEYVAATAPQQR